MLSTVKWHLIPPKFSAFRVNKIKCLIKKVTCTYKHDEKNKMFDEEKYLL